MDLPRPFPHNSGMIARLVLTVTLAGCTAPQPLAGNEAAARQTAGTKEASVETNSPATPAGQPVAGLPFSHGKSFRTLDEYLDHLERYAAPIDQPWWREIRPGVYEHVKRIPGAPRDIATRAELMQRFGFTS